MFAAADPAIADGANLLVLSDRGIDQKHAGIPALLATAGLHHHLIRQGTRTLVSLILESGEPREVHHFALLFSYGADVINPYLAFETLYDLIHDGKLSVDYEKACKNFIKAGVKSVIKTMAKMGISTYASYRGAQIFEAIGINHEVVDKYFHRTASRIEGISLDTIADEVAQRHRHAFPPLEGEDAHALEAGGVYQWRADGEFHLWNPQSIHKLQKATRANDFAIFKEYTKLIDDQSRNLCTLRGLFEFKFAGKPVPLEEVESVETIVKRFKTGAMSYGSISKEAHEALAIAMNRLGGKSNTGEGGEDPLRYQLEPNGDSKNSAIKQVASGRFGVTSYYLVNAQELQIKMAQGAKPGEGGELPGTKVYPPIAKVRGTTPGVGLISPPPHHDIYSIEDLVAAHPRPEKRQLERPHQRQARRRNRRRHHRRGRRQGQGGRDPHLRPRRRHRRVAALLDPARRRAVGTRPRRDQPDFAAQQPAQPRGRRDGRPAQDRARRRHRRAPRRGGIRLRHRAAGDARLPDDARLPPQHLPGRHRHPGPAPARKIQRRPGIRRALHAFHRAGNARIHGPARLPHRQRNGRPRGPPRRATRP